MDFFNKRICSFLTELTVGKAKVVRPEQIRLLLERATRFAGGGSRRFNHVLAELTTGQICSQLLETALQKKRCVLLGCHTDSILLRKICRRASGLFLPPPRKTVGFPKTCGNFSQFFRRNWTNRGFFRPQQNPRQKARHVSSEQIRLLLERAISFTGGGASQHNAGASHSMGRGGCEELASSFSLLPPNHWQLSTNNYPLTREC